MSLTQDRINEIEFLSLDILQSAYSPSDVTAPINLDKVLAFAEIKPIFATFKEEDVEGILMKNDASIYINNKANYERQAFTIAHELGHFYLHNDQQEDIFYRRDILNITKEKRGLEQEANWFGGALLMPKNLVFKYWTVTQSVVEISMKFSVSANMAYYRLKNLKLFP